MRDDGPRGYVWVMYAARGVDRDMTPFVSAVPVEHSVEKAIALAEASVLSQMSNAHARTLAKNDEAREETKLLANAIADYKVEGHPWGESNTGAPETRPVDTPNESLIERWRRFWGSGV